MASHYRIHITGIVQGVGFRPFVYALACAHGVVGTVCNNAGGVVIDCVLSPENLDGFVQDLQNNPPPAASIVSLVVTPLSTPIAFTSFAIIASQDDDSSAIYISPDLCLCKTCQTECFDPLNPRYLHPFINCTDCGSRYSIITDTPYDRPMTSMAGFAMCERCADEYHQPSDRRYHAEPICCPQCGPVCTLVRLHPDQEVGRLGECGPLFDAGQVGAVKGCGGFQICCDARDDEAIERIRILKQRPHKPFALMARSLSDLKRLCVVSPDEEALLVSSACPIVLLKIKDSDRVSTKIAPSLGHIGVMLPTTGLHQLLFHYSRLSFLLMTSANLSGEPLISEVDDLKRDLAPLLDFYIDHNRQIVSPIDDSVQMVVAHRSRLLRRARGYVPQPIPLPVDVSGVVALGGQQKSCFALGRGREAFLGPHIGTLGYLKTNQFFKKSLSAMQGVLQLSADFAVHDLHPRFETTKMATEFGKKRVAVQHHHAHHASCMAENGQTKPCLGLILDGSGYGDDGTVWGGNYSLLIYAIIRG